MLEHGTGWRQYEPEQRMVLVQVSFLSDVILFSVFPMFLEEVTS